MEFGIIVDFVVEMDFVMVVGDFDVGGVLVEEVVLEGLDFFDERKVEF